MERTAINFVKYIISSSLSFLIDIGLFYLLILFIPDGVRIRIMMATFFARVCSSIFNYWVNKNIVFQNKQKGLLYLFHYYILVIVQLLLSGMLVMYFYQLSSLNETVIKVIVDSFLFFMSYFIQKIYIFRLPKEQPYRVND